MNLTDQIPTTDKPVIVKNILKGNGTASLIKLKKDGILDKHQSKTNALLILLQGQVTYEEADRKVDLAEVYDFVQIPEKVTHKLIAKGEALLLLVQ